MNLERYQQDGLELYIDTLTGESYASQSSLARMCSVGESTIRYWKTSQNIHTKNAEVPTNTGFKTSQLYNEDSILLAFEKYNKDLFIQCAKAGVRVFLHGLAGYKVTTTAVEKVEYQTQKMISPGSVEDTVTGIKMLFQEMNISPEYLPGILAEGVKEAHPQLAGTAEQMKILMASNAENDIQSQSFTVTEIGDKLAIKFSAVKLNKILSSMGYQTREGKRWVLTELGRENGGVVIATTSKGSQHSREQIRWKEEIVDRINEYLEN